MAVYVTLVEQKNAPKPKPIKLINNLASCKSFFFKLDIFQRLKKKNIFRHLISPPTLSPLPPLEPPLQAHCALPGKGFSSSFYTGGYQAL